MRKLQACNLRAEFIFIHHNRLSDISRYTKEILFTVKLKSGKNYESKV